MKNKKFLIYGLFSPITGELKYIGKTIESLNIRLNKHLSRKYNSYKSCWISSLLKKELKPNIQAIQELYSENDLNKAEIYWIKYFRKQGCKLTNLTDGGEGSSGYRHSEKTRFKISQLQMGKLNHNWGKSKSEYIKRKISFSEKGKKVSEEIKIKLSRSHGGKPFQDQFGNIYQTQMEASRKLKLSSGHISEVLNEKIKSTGGYVFSYLDNQSLVHG